MLPNAVRPGLLGGRWAHVPFEPDKLFRLKKCIGRRFPRFYPLLWRWPSDWGHLTRERLKDVRMTLGDQAFDIIHTLEGIG